MIYDFGKSSIPKNPRDNDANPRDAKRAALSSMTFPLWIPPYILITARNGPFPGGKNKVPRILPSWNGMLKNRTAINLRINCNNIGTVLNKVIKSVIYLNWQSFNSRTHVFSLNSRVFCYHNSLIFFNITTWNMACNW